MRILSALLALTLLSGCIQQHTVLKLKPDGSGTLEQTEMYSKQMLAMGGDNPEARAQLFSEEKAKAKAKDLGADFVSAEKVTEGNFEGQKAIYSFKDVTKVKFDQIGGDKKDMGPPGAPKEEEKEAPKITFTKSAAGNPLLTIVFPKGKPKEAPKDGEPKKDPAEEAAQMEMMKPMLAGMRFTLSVIPEGTVVKTNSEHVAGNKVTIYEIPFDELLANPEIMKKMENAPDDPEALAKILKEVKGVKMITSNEFTLEFK